MMEQKWIEYLEPLMKQYDKHKYPLDYKSHYQ